MSLGRRRFIAATAGTLAAGALAGCTAAGGGDDAASGTGDGTAAASFFVFGDVTAAVAGEAAKAELLVPTGQHGHGWEPGPRVREAIRDAELFVHGMAGFQPWVDSIRQDLEADDAPVRALDVTESVDLLEAGGDHDEHAEEEHTEHHDDHTNTTEHHDEHTGSTDHHDDHADSTEHHDEHTDSPEHHEEHDHGSVDPHFWMDPRRVKTAAGTVQEALADVDGDNADSYEANAQAFGEELDALDDELRSIVDGASNEVLLVAGHDSFQYLAARYGVHVVALTNVSPDDRPTARDIERAQEVIAEHDLQYVCADPMESQQAAEALVEETDAEAVLPLTAMPGLTDEWAENDWGYVDVMTEVNLPTLRAALGA